MNAPQPRSVETLLELLATGARFKYLHFWGHQPQRDGSIGSGCLSQWWPAEITIGGVRFATAEHFMMWSKARLFGDDDIAKQILDASHPHRAKALGREIDNFDQAAWERERFDIVVTATVAKFSQHRDLGAFLRSTGNRVLVEASPVDPVWGIGLAADDEHARDPAKWRGLNLLGFALMEARSRLGPEPAPSRDHR